jgi:hypothetical protein
MELCNGGAVNGLNWGIAERALKNSLGEDRYNFFYKNGSLNNVPVDEVVGIFNGFVSQFGKNDIFGSKRASFYLKDAHVRYDLSKKSGRVTDISLASLICSICDCE